MRFPLKGTWNGKEFSGYATQFLDGTHCVEVTSETLTAEELNPIANKLEAVLKGEPLPAEFETFTVFK